MRWITLALLVGAAQARWILRDEEGTPVLEVYYQTEAEMVYRDESTLIWDYLSVWEPRPHENFFMAAHRAQDNWEDMTGTIVMLRDITGDFESRYLTPPVDLDEVWRDEGGLGTYDVAFWRPNCTQGFYPLGDIAYACEWCGWPKPLAYLGRVVCVAQQFVEECGFYNEPLWTNNGGIETLDGSVWTILPVRGVSGFWMGNQGHETPPNESRGYCLKQPEREG